MHQIAQICTYIFTNFPGVIPPDSQNWEGVSPFPLGACIHCPTYSEVPLPLPLSRHRVERSYYTHAMDNSETVDNTQSRWQIQLISNDCIHASAIHRKCNSANCFTQP